ncbi:Putative dolichyl pyrophosphate Man9GlcNAc2 alpha-1,3-glucosyltransferase, partial [Picochlorum sp. SENEW3]
KAMLQESRTARWLSSGIVALGLVLRLCLGSHSYSGKGNPPMYMNTTENDLGYWGIDYPPLSAYQSWLSGKFVSLFDQRSVVLLDSRGYENASSKLGMRLSVIAADLLVYIPACLALSSTIPLLSERMFVLLVLVCNPAVLIIDHGHFQYNGIGLGLTIGAIFCIVTRRYLMGSALFCCALNHKQMTLYFAPAVFVHLLGMCLKEKKILGKATMLARLGAVVVVSFIICWIPFIGSMEMLQQVIKRIFPLQRGLFEDYVANFWCVSSLIFKWKKYITGAHLAKMCAMATMVASLPSLIMEVTKPSRETFILCLMNTSLAFFLFSYQVHEKSILIPLMPMSILMYPSRRASSVYALNISLMTMYPLLKKDGLLGPYWAMHVLALSFQYFGNQEGSFSGKCKLTNIRSILEFAVFSPLVLVGIFLVHVFCVIAQPYTTKEYFTDAVIMAAGFGFLVLQLLIGNIRQYIQWKAN